MFRAHLTSRSLALDKERNSGNPAFWTKYMVFKARISASFRHYVEQTPAFVTIITAQNGTDCHHAELADVDRRTVHRKEQGWQYKEQMNEIQEHFRNLFHISQR